MLYNWNNQEYSGKMYVYCSKNGNDTLASNFFGKAVAWVSGAVTYVGERRTYSSKQYRNITGVNTSTNPATDTVNWAFDFDNFQTYDSTKVYAIGTRTNSGNEHWVCNVAGSTGAFQATNWTKQIISNRDIPYKLQNTAINLINSDARFVSSEVLDVVNNIAYHNIHCVLSNGIWAETLTAPTKYIRIIGQSNLKTAMNMIYNANPFYENLLISQTASVNVNFYIKAANCIFNAITTSDSSGASNSPYFYFSFKNIFKSLFANPAYFSVYIYHCVNNVIYTSGLGQPNYNATTVFRNNYIKGSTISLGTLAQLQMIAIGNLDYNFYEGTIQVGGVTQATIAALQATLPNQNIYSQKGTATLNSDYTLPVGSPLIKTGSNGNNIGAEGVGYPQTNSTTLDSANGAIYKNVTKYGTTLTRQQISKTAQGGGNNYITLEALASSVNNEYDGFRIYISSGTGSGQTRTILTYNASTKDATVNSNWTVNPDSSSIYEILDGEITSAIADNGSIQTFKKWLVQVTNYYDVTGYVINQNVSSSDARLDSASALTFDLRVGNTSDLISAPWRRFLQDHYLMVDNQNRGCGDASFDYTNVVSSVLTFRYSQVKIMLHK